MRLNVLFKSWKKNRVKIVRQVER